LQGYELIRNENRRCVDFYFFVHAGGSEKKINRLELKVVGRVSVFSESKEKRERKTETERSLQVKIKKHCLKRDNGINLKQRTI